MHVYSNIIMHSVQNPDYIVFFLFWEKKNSWPRVILTRGSHMAMCLNYTWPFGHAHWNKWPHGRV
jgi:hypothetical protein